MCDTADGVPSGQSVSLLAQGDGILSMPHCQPHRTLLLFVPRHSTHECSECVSACSSRGAADHHIIHWTR
eukprot:5619107-Prorocentrum_lima.AAC.1